MFESLSNIFESLRKPHLKQVFFRSLPLNRKLLLWYADKLISKDSTIDSIEQLREIDSMRKSGQAFTFISNHLTYADSHIIETLFIRNGFKDLADHLVHVAGQKTFEFSRRFLTRSLNTIRVYQPKADIEGMLKKKMNSRALKWAERMKRKGYSLLVFPEGTRTRMVKRFNLKSGNPRTTIYFRKSLVVPLALMGAENLMPVGRSLPRPGSIRLKIGNPINHIQLEEEFRKKKEYQSEKEFQQALLRDYMNQINDLLAPEYRYKEPDQVPGI
ncbi:MAG TPA: lysophospholipid acyltransferase family protein [Acidobacteriota bacterium]|nr:lysophospholipid acyltransferase family protein [Acidobacteriota bacterium]